MLLRVCVWNLTHTRPLIMGFSERDNPIMRGITGGICEECLTIMRQQRRHGKGRIVDTYA